MEIIIGLLGTIVGYLMSIGREEYLNSRKKKAVLEELNESIQSIDEHRTILFEWNMRHAAPHLIQWSILEVNYPSICMMFTTNQRQTIRTMRTQVDEFNRLSELLVSSPSTSELNVADTLVKLIKITYYLEQLLSSLNSFTDRKPPKNPSYSEEQKAKLLEFKNNVVTN